MNSPAFTFQAGTRPLLISMPHCGTRLTGAVEQGLAPYARDLKDTDWHIPQLYQFARDMNVSILSAEYSRYVVDLNRPEDDQPLYSSATTGLFPQTQFDGQPLFSAGREPGAEAQQQAREQVWQPYHQQLQAELARLKQQHGYAILLDAHSINGHIPRLFEGRLPDLNFGTFEGASCAEAMADLLPDIQGNQPQFTQVVNGRFKGGHITRHYGQPEQHIHALQLELAQSTYMQEQAPFSYLPEQADRLIPVLSRLLNALLTWGGTTYSGHAG